MADAGDRPAPAAWRLLEVTAGLLIGAMTVLVTIQVFARYVLNDTPPWSEELCRYLFVWASFLGACLPMGSAAHLGVDSLVVRLPAPVRETLRHAVTVLVALFAGMLVWQGAALVPAMATQRSPSMGISLMYVFAAIPVAGAIMLALQIRELARAWASPGLRLGVVLVAVGTVAVVLTGRLVPVGELERGLAVVRDPEGEQQIGPAHDAEPDAPVGLHGRVDLRQRIRVDLDHVVEEAHGQPHHPLEIVPVDGRRVTVERFREARDVDGAQIARVPRRQTLFTTWVCRLDQRDLGRRIGRAPVDAVEEDHAGIAGAPRRAHDAVEHLARRQPPRRAPGARVDEVVLPARREGVHERVGDGDRDIEVRDPAVELALDELEDVRVVHPENPHVGAASRAPLLDRLRGRIEHAEERDWTRRAPAGRLHEVVLRPQP